MPTIPAPKDQWYVVHVLSGSENKVKRHLDRRLQAEEMSDYVFDVLVPSELVSEVKGGSKREINRKFFPGYVIVNMHLLDENNKLIDKTWYFIQEQDGVINFAGNKNHPIPMPQNEVESMLAQIQEKKGSIAPSVEHEIGDTVVVADGPFEGQSGVIEEIDTEKGELTVSVDIFGRKQPVPLEYWQVEKA